METLALQVETDYIMDLRDQGDYSNPSLHLHVQKAAVDRFLTIGIDGFGEKTAQDGHGFPIVIEYYNGHLILRVWSDINSEEPTHTISLDGARESRRDDNG